MQSNGSLLLTSLTTDDSGVYTCSAKMFDEFGFVNDLDQNQEVQGRNYTLMELNKFEIHVRTTPGAVASFTCRATTIIGKDSQNLDFKFLVRPISRPPRTVVILVLKKNPLPAVIIWEVWPNRTGGYPIRDFTADMRRVPDFGENETEWQLLDPHHISPNAVSPIFK